MISNDSYKREKEEIARLAIEQAARKEERDKRRKVERALSSSSIFANCVTSLEGQMKRIAVHIHYPECWDTMAYPTLADAVCEITCCNIADCTHAGREQAKEQE